MVEIPEPTKLLDSSDIANLLGVGRNTATTLMRAGVLGEVFSIGRASGVRSESIIPAWVDAVANSLTLPPAILLKVGALDQNPERMHFGFHASMSIVDIEESCLKYYIIKSPERVVSRLVVVAVSGVVVYSGRVTGFTKQFNRLTALQAESIDTPYDGKRLATQKGGSIEYWGDWA